MKTCIACQKSEFKNVKYPGSNNKLNFDTIEVCRHCGMGQVKTDKSQDEINSIYSDGDYWHKIQATPEIDLHYIAQARHRLKSIQPFISKNNNLRILDVGAGQGSILVALAESKILEKYEYFFFEPDNDMASSIEKKGGKRISSLNSGGNLYDVIFLNHVLEHVIDPISMLQSLKALLDQSGLIYIEVPNEDYKFKTEVFPHTLFFSLDSLKKLTEQEGYDIKYFRIFGRRSVEKRKTLFEKGYNFFLYHLTTKSLKAGVHSIARLANDLRFGYGSNQTEGIWLCLIAKL